MYKFSGILCLFWVFFLFALQVVATAGIQDSTPNFMGSLEVAKPPPPAAQFHHIQSRQQSAGSSCSQEGQWNCMTNSFQRCGAGLWSVVMQCAKGTNCSPVGLTTEFRIQHDGSVNGNGGTPTTSTASSSSSSNAASARIWGLKMVVVGVILSWCFC